MHKSFLQFKKILSQSSTYEEIYQKYIECDFHEYFSIDILPRLQ